ncbi:MAG: DNA-binding response regulator [Bacteroidetes bacterium 24-39-8]|jgi:DNA-binding response OmpR family regulator|nr:MAG: DNA-binding response regulator [Sphingobacteriia bacterium 35-40-5]OYZ51192.1 MAG: DNA-binding response regulator [Bacteroidetes bacterium 24-39-8]HQR94693.1 response regulator transcription factor [Sediminibacterium sp.]HQS54694.1 response regulator transcription factor [Sediminibacterium sp.]
MKLLLAEDEPKVANAVKTGLEEQGLEVTIAFDGRMAEKYFERDSFDCIILDINLPHKNGLDLCKQFRNRNKKVPIILLTALGELEDKMEGFSAGADDYLVKPFHLQELLARIHAIVKRSSGVDQPQNIMEVGDLVLDLDAKSVKRAGKLIKLTQKEFLLLEALTKARGRVLSKADLAEKVWALDFDTGTNTVEVYINFLRNKIDKQHSVKLIHTRTGFGYYLKEEA